MCKKFKGRIFPNAATQQVFITDWNKMFHYAKHFCLNLTLTLYLHYFIMNYKIYQLIYDLPIFLFMWVIFLQCTSLMTMIVVFYCPDYMKSVLLCLYVCIYVNRVVCYKGENVNRNNKRKQVASKEFNSEP